MRKILIIVLVVAAVAAGIFFLLKKPAVPAKAGGGDEEVNPNAVVTVKVGNLSLATVHSFVDAYGLVGGAPAMKGEPAAGAKVTAPQAGVLRKAYVAEGDEVKMGDRLFDLDDRAAVASLEKAKRAAQAAHASMQRQQELLAGQNTSAKAVQEAVAGAASADADVATAQTQLSWVHIVAPLAGTITKVGARAGENVDPATTLAEITDLHRLVVSVDIPADEASHIAVGNDAEVQVDPGIRGKVVYIAPAVDPAANTVTVRASLPDDAAVRPGQYVQLRIVAELHKNSLVAPVEAVITTEEEGKTVIALVQGDQAVQKEVQTGIKEGSVIEVQGDGLKAGDKIVTMGAYGLPEKSKIKIVQ
jgi:membrane fusion protein (multidrug efflux system)